MSGALLNMQTEIPGWDFEQVKQKAQAQWNDELQKIGILTVYEITRIICGLDGSQEICKSLDLHERARVGAARKRVRGVEGEIGLLVDGGAGVF